MAIALPTVVALLGLIIGVAAAGLGQMRCADAARAGARAAAVGQSLSQITAVAKQIAGDEVEVIATGGQGTIEVTVRLPLDLAVGQVAVHRVIEASAVAMCEPIWPCG